MKKLITILLSVALIATMVPCTAFAAGGETYSTSIKEAGAKLRAAMVERQSKAEIRYAIPTKYSFDQKTINKLAGDIYAEAVKHTGNPKEGDSLEFVTDGYQVSATAKAGQGVYDTTLTYSLRYYTTAAQEKELDQTIASLKKKLALEGKSDYDKLHEVHDYMVNNISYDYNAKKYQNNPLAHTAYNALVKKKSVCQGYATLYYRMALEYGIDCRIVTGMSEGDHHAWNIVRLNGKWYNLDATWDACTHSHKYFLKGGVDFKEHVRDKAYKAPDFVKTYVMCGADYETGIKEHQEKTVITAATKSKDGSVVVTCQICGEQLSKQVIRKIGKVSLSTTSAVVSTKAKSPKVIVKDASGKTIPSKYYTVKTPSGRKNVGSYTYTVTFKDYYSGIKTAKLKIVPKTPTSKKAVASKKAFTAKWKKVSGTQYDGYQLQYSTKKSFTKDKRTITVKGTKATSKKISKLKAKKIYYVRVRTYEKVGKTTYYSAWSKAQKVKTK